jgi:type II secretory pathway component GspD/PulD (secretin)
VRTNSDPATSPKGTSLRNQLDKPGGKAVDVELDGSHHETESNTTPLPAGDTTNEKNTGDSVVLNRLEPDHAVTLGPDLEVDPAARDRHIAAGDDDKSYPKAKIVPQVDSVAPVAVASSAGLESRLSGMQQDINRIGRIIEEQSQREASRDPMKQATELIKQLQEANLIGPRARHDESVAQNSQVAEPPDNSPAVEAPPRTYDQNPEARDDQTAASARPNVLTQIIRPRYVSATAIQVLITPLLTPGLGRIGAADLESEQDAADGIHISAAGSGALVVCDLPEVMDRVQALLKKLDVAPDSVIIEAVVISVQLQSDRPNGIDLLEFNGSIQPFRMIAVDAGTPVEELAAPSSTGSFGTDPLQLTRKYGLKRGVLNGDPQAFLSALGVAGQVRRVDAWQMTVANRRAANLMLTDPFGPDSSAEHSAGTVIRVRPLAIGNGTIHLDVRQDPALKYLCGSKSRSAALNNQFTLQPGQTAVIGGILADQAVLHTYSRSGLGDMPVFGGLFCKQVEGVERAETIVLLTPHLVSNDSNQQAMRGKGPAIRAIAPSKTSKQGKIIPAAGSQERKSPMKQRLKIK